jgi:hypothetical protein
MTKEEVEISEAPGKTRKPKKAGSGQREMLMARARSNHQPLSGFNSQEQSQEMRVTELSRSPVRREALGPSLDFD